LVAGGASIVHVAVVDKYPQVGMRGDASRWPHSAVAGGRQLARVVDKYPQVISFQPVRRGHFHPSPAEPSKPRLWISIHMEIGCGLEVRTVNGRRYVYFWSYTRENGSNMRKWRYLGVAGADRTRRRALESLTAHYSSIKKEVDRRLAVMKMKASAP